MLFLEDISGAFIAIQNGAKEMKNAPYAGKKDHEDAAEKPARLRLHAASLRLFDSVSGQEADQRKLVFTNSNTSSPRPLITARIMYRLKPLAWASLILGGMPNSCLAVTTSSNTGPG